MPELTEAIAAAHRMIQKLSALAGDATDGEARSLLSNLELHLAKIEAKTAHLKLENIELRRHVGGAGEFESGKGRKIFGDTTTPRADVRRAMQQVSEFYQLFSRDREYRKAG